MYREVVVRAVYAFNLSPLLLPMVPFTPTLTYTLAFSLCEIFECAHLQFTVSGSVQASSIQ